MHSISRRQLYGLPKAAALAVAVTFGAVDISVWRAEYSEREITIIVCFPPGGGTDIAARLIDSYLSEALGKPVVVANRGGAGGNVGIAAVARAPADG
jgi:tripartite-type tricarboxylate transporter receptor subunit TctC